MGHERDGICFELLSTQSFENQDLARSTLELLVRGLGFLRPVRFGALHPLERELRDSDLQPLIDRWFQTLDPCSPFSDAGQRLLCLEDAHGLGEVMVSWTDNRQRLNSISGSFPSRYLSDEAAFESFFSWLEVLAATVDPVCGFVQNMMTKGWATSYDLHVRLPEVPWGIIYGAPYIEMFGAEKLRTAPYAFVDQWRSGHLFCRLTDDLLDPELPSELRRAVKEHLGVDAFMHGSRPHRYYKDGRSPLSR